MFILAECGERGNPCGLLVCSARKTD